MKLWIRCRSILLSAVLLSILFAACDSREESDEYAWFSEEDIMQARQDCTDLIEAYCLALDDCDDYEDRDECERNIASGLDCDSALGTGELYNDCMDDLNDLDCEEGIDFPESCTGVIFIGQDGY
jgi:hypothetical protein